LKTIHGAKGCNLTSKFPQNGEFSAPNIAFFDENLLTRKFSGSPKFWKGTKDGKQSTIPLATTPMRQS